MSSASHAESIRKTRNPAAQWPRQAAARPPQRRAPTYSPAVIEALGAIWEAAGYHCVAAAQGPAAAVAAVGAPPVRLRRPWNASCWPSARGRWIRAGSDHRRPLGRGCTGEPSRGIMNQAPHPPQKDSLEVATPASPGSTSSTNAAAGGGEFVHSIKSTESTPPG